MNRTEMIGDFQHRPLTPRLLLPIAPMIPADVRAVTLLVDPRAAPVDEVDAAVVVDVAVAVVVAAVARHLLRRCATGSP